MSDQIMGQMTIFDFSEYMPASCADDLEQMTLEEVTNKISKSTGLEFKACERFDADVYYEARPMKGIRVSIGLCRFNADGVGYKEGQRFISTGIDARNSGMGSPCMTINDAIECIRKHLPRYIEEVRAKK